MSWLLERVLGQRDYRLDSTPHTRQFSLTICLIAYGSLSLSRALSSKDRVLLSSLRNPWIPFRRTAQQQKIVVPLLWKGINKTLVGKNCLSVPSVSCNRSSKWSFPPCSMALFVCICLYRADFCHHFHILGSGGICFHTWPLGCALTAAAFFLERSILTQAYIPVGQRSIAQDSDQTTPTNYFFVYFYHLLQKALRLFAPLFVS